MKRQLSEGESDLHLLEETVKDQKKIWGKKGILRDSCSPFFTSFMKFLVEYAHHSAKMNASYRTV